MKYRIEAKLGSYGENYLTLDIHLDDYISEETFSELNEAVKKIQDIVERVDVEQRSERITQLETEAKS